MISCEICPLNKNCKETYKTNDDSIQKNIESFIEEFISDYPLQIGVNSLVDGKHLIYKTSPADIENRVIHMREWLTGTSNKNDGFAYYAEYLLVKLIAQLALTRNLENLDVTLTPTQLDCVHGKDGRGGDVIIFLDGQPVCLIDNTISNSKGRGKNGQPGIHRPTGIPVIEFSMQTPRKPDCFDKADKATDFVRRISEFAIRQGIYVTNGEFFMPENHINLLKNLFGEKIISSALYTLNKIQQNPKTAFATRPAQQAHEILTKIFN